MSSNPENPVITPEDFVRQLRALREQMVLFTPIPGASRRLAHVDADFVNATVNAAGTSESVSKAIGHSDEELRHEIEVSARWTAVTDEVRALLKATHASDTARRQRIGLRALQTYQICQQLARSDAHASLEPHIGEMRRLNRFGRKRRKPAQQPAPEVPTQTQ